MPLSEAITAGFFEKGETVELVRLKANSFREASGTFTRLQIPVGKYGVIKKTRRDHNGIVSAQSNPVETCNQISLWPVRLDGPENMFHIDRVRTTNRL